MRTSPMSCTSIAKNKQYAMLLESYQLKYFLRDFGFKNILEIMEKFHWSKYVVKARLDLINRKKLIAIDGNKKEFKGVTNFILERFFKNELKLKYIRA